tara:strand:+ start:168 stop:401 length:234 start_codon:yes stop_codon:yes gene_type:complete
MVQIKNKCTVYVDAFELSGKLMDSGIEEGSNPSIDQIDEIMRDISWVNQGEDLDSVTKYEMFAVASKAIVRMEQLGN